MSHKTRKILLTGGSGTIGRAVAQTLRANGCMVKNLTRTPKNDHDLPWNPDKGEMDAQVVEGMDAVVHLAGEGIADHRWTDPRKKAIIDSRTTGTQLLAQSIATAHHKPRVLISASGVGYYPLNTGVIYDESGPVGKSFLAEVCAQWEAATMLAENAGVRVVKLRIGVVLSREGGALEKMVPIFNKGLGGPAGDGKQHLSWIAMDDLIEIIIAAMEDECFRGPVNAVAPEVVSNQVFAHALATMLGKPAKMATPAFALKLMFGQMAEETILADLSATPRKLQEAGFRWKHPNLEGALRYALK